MKPEEVFNLAVRLLGLVFLYHGLQTMPAALAQIFSSFPHQLGPGVRTDMRFGAFFMGIVMVGWPLLLAWWLVRGAPFIMRVAYPDGSVRRKDERQIGGGVGHKTDA